MRFKVGCNYWASSGGIRMWCEWNEESIREDLEVLASNGISYLRIFPLWSDFQPVKPAYGYGSVRREYRMEDDSLPTNPWYLDDTMIYRLRTFCEIAGQYGMKLIVGLLTGWMSGRCFIPAALYEKDLYSDSQALLLEQKYVEGIVRLLKDQPQIEAWDLGNECNCLYNAANRDIAENWTMVIANTIRANDPSRPVVSGMHSLNTEGIWRIQDQAAHTDVLTTHPYPFFVEYCSVDDVLSYRTLMHATCETRYYSDIGNKPCLVEEIGTLGPAKCDQTTAALFLKCNLYSNWIHGAQGVLWWCANDMMDKEYPPYSWNFCERELGLVDRNRKPKPVLKEIQEFSNWLENDAVELPQMRMDGVCILTGNQHQWGTAYTSWLLAKQAKVSLKFAWAEQEIPQSDVYLLPSMEGDNGIPLNQMKLIAERVKNGAVLYVSSEDVMMMDFSELTGLEINDSNEHAESGFFELENSELWYRRFRTRRMRAVSAEVLAADKKGNPLFTVNCYGKGRVYYLNFCLEKYLQRENEAFEANQHMIYREVFNKQIASHPVDSITRNLGITCHDDELGCYVTLLNYSAQTIEPEYRMNNSGFINIFGDAKRLEPAQMAILCFPKKEK